MASLVSLALFERLRGASSVLIAGAGGGFDVYAGLPLALALEAGGTRVHLSNVTFSDIASAETLGPGLSRIEPTTPGSSAYFPERTLARWRASRGEDPIVYALDPEGVQPQRASYQLLAEQLDLDAVVLVDAGTDILLTGDEVGLGTPEEDVCSLVALHGLTRIPTRLLVSIGFGIDAFHGVNHTDVLENIAALTRAGAFLGTFSVPAASEEARAYLDAVEHAQLHTATRPSIVNGQIAAAIAGEFGDRHFTGRTVGSELFINPLMSLYFCFELDGVGQRLGYLDGLRGTQTRREARTVIEDHRSSLRPRRPRVFPH